MPLPLDATPLKAASENGLASASSAATLVEEHGADVNVVQNSASPTARSVADIRSDYWALTKPGITTMVLVTTWIGHFMGASEAGVALADLVPTILGALFLVMGGSTMNQVFEVSSDAKMSRTANRPLPAGRVSVFAASLFGMALSLAGMAILYLYTPLIATFVAVSSWLLYVFVYTGLKPISSTATIIGAIPGALPPLIGYTAAIGRIDTLGLYLFLILFFWQFPHFLAIGWMHREDYSKGGIKVLAVSDPNGLMTSRQMLLYSVALAFISLFPVVAGYSGALYALTAAILGTLMIREAWRCTPAALDALSRRLFFATLIYLPVLLTAMVADRMLGSLLT